MKLSPLKQTTFDGMTFLETILEDADKPKDDSLQLPIETTYETVFEQTPGIFRIIYPHQYPQFDSSSTYFYQDDNRTFFVTWSTFLVIPKAYITYGNLFQPKYLKMSMNCDFIPFYHPYACEFIKQLNLLGIDALLDPASDSELCRQNLHDEKYFEHDYKPTSYVKTCPVEDIDFSLGGAYSQYNWELFFHAPLLIADRLSQNQRFEEAMQWFHYIFDPTETSGGATPARFWKVRPFYEPYEKKNGKPKRIQELMNLLNKGDKELEKRVK